MTEAEIIAGREAARGRHIQGGRYRNFCQGCGIMLEVHASRRWRLDCWCEECAPPPRTATQIEADREAATLARLLHEAGEEKKLNPLRGSATRVRHPGRGGT